MELGLYTFGDMVAHPETGAALSPGQRTAEILAAARLADERGLDVFGLGEHHRLDTLVSSPAVMLSAIAAQTKQIALTSATTVLPTLDPVRVFEDFATADLVSGGRVEIIAGRGAFTESYPLFGVSLDDRDARFAEHLELLLRLRDVGDGERITWHGRFRAPLEAAQVAPRPARRIPIWVGVGVTPESARRAGALGLPMNLALLSLGGRMAHLADAYREAAAGKPGTRVALSRHMHIQKDGKRARDDFYLHLAHYFHAMGRPKMSRADFDALAEAEDGLMVGDPEEVAQKIVREHAMFRHDRFIAQVDIGGMPYAKVAEAIELFAGEVAPRVRRALS
jgi:alkanesulfonate monooxygenase SsuD/methylene tetrahydromethanopterin reductase-like flavin-dependent oxidoreductase (luciferase family)